MKKEYVVRVQVGTQNDEQELAKVLKENKYHKLKNAELEGDKVKLTFSEASIDCSKRVLQVSKKKYGNVYNRIINVLQNEEPPQLFKKHKSWLILTIIELSDKWLVFMI